jgi:uncharacterized protein YneF (UPF0154 family)
VSSTLILVAIVLMTGVLMFLIGLAFGKSIARHETVELLERETRISPALGRLLAEAERREAPGRGPDPLF